MGVGTGSQGLCHCLMVGRRRRNHTMPLLCPCFLLPLNDGAVGILERPREQKRNPEGHCMARWNKTYNKRTMILCRTLYPLWDPWHSSWPKPTTPSSLSQMVTSTSPIPKTPMQIESSYIHDSLYYLDQCKGY
jgi:hypothetical protein